MRIFEFLMTISCCLSDIKLVGTVAMRIKDQDILI